QDGAGNLTIASDNGTFERVTFPIPSNSLTINAGDGDDVISLDLLNVPGLTLDIEGGSGTDRLVANRNSAITLNDTNLLSTGETVGLGSSEQASLSGVSLDSTGFSGAVGFATAVPQWTPEGPGPITGGQVAGMNAQNKPVDGAISSVLAGDDG